MKINKKLGVLIGGFLTLFCGSAIINGTIESLKNPNNSIKKIEVVETKKENRKITHKDFSITDGKIYKDIEISKDLRSYKIPAGKWEIMKLDDGYVKMNDEKEKVLKNALLTFSSNKKGNTDIHYEKSFEYEVDNDETVWLSIPGEGTQLYFTALN